MSDFILNFLSSVTCLRYKKILKHLGDILVNSILTNGNMDYVKSLKSSAAKLGWQHRDFNL